MNRLLTAGLVFSVAAAVVCRQRISLATARSEWRRLASQTETASRALESAQQELAQVEKQLAAELAHARGLGQDLREWDAHTEPALELPRSLGPGQCWPATESWCYLPKTILTRLGYMTFDPDGHLTAQTALLFGMSRAERARVEDAYAELSRELQALDLAHMRPVTTTGHFRDSEFIRQSYGLELPAEQAAALHETFDAAIRDVLAGDRGDLFLQANRRLLDEWFQDLDSSPVRITVFTPAKSPDQGYARLLVEYKVSNLDSDRPEDCKLFYPNDETAVGFQRFATLVRNYLTPSGP